MSYASVASHNSKSCLPCFICDFLIQSVEFGEQPKPDQALADGSFEESTNADSKVCAMTQSCDHSSYAQMNVLPPGSDPNRPDEAADRHDPKVVDANDDSVKEGKGEIKVGPSKAEIEAKAKEAKAEAEKQGEALKKKGKQAGDKAKVCCRIGHIRIRIAS